MKNIRETINKEIERLDKVTDKLHKQYNKETNYGTYPNTTRGIRIMQEIYNIGDAKAILRDAENKLQSFNIYL